MAPVPITADYYQILQVSQCATTETIARSYKQLAFVLHPDKNKKADATEAFQLVCFSRFLQSEIPSSRALP
jgi:DnaJ-class molecular chaperone